MSSQSIMASRPGRRPDPAQPRRPLLLPPEQLAARTRSLTLQPSYQTTFTPWTSGAFRISYTVTDATHVDPAIFLFLAEPPLPGQADQVAAFQKICSPVDLAEFPAGQPWPGSDPAWFRMSTVTLDFRDKATALQVKAMILSQVQGLLNSLDEVERLTDETPIVLAAAGP